MNTEHLKLSAGHVRDLLNKHNVSIGHSQSLDVIAALPGLRNWPEVMSFPEQVGSKSLDISAASRLSTRIDRRFNLDIKPARILELLLKDSFDKPNAMIQVWPSGPKPGVYVTWTEEAIENLIEQYDEATDGEIYYHEAAGAMFDGGIDLGENGLWSGGLERLASGTLIVVGPLVLTEENWEDCAQRLEIACLLALSTHLRIAVLIDSPTPHSICEDALLMIQSRQPEIEDYDSALMGLIFPDGKCQINTPFSQGFVPPKQSEHEINMSALPAKAIPLLKEALYYRSTGILSFGSTKVDRELTGMDLVAASLGLTKHLGPAARIIPHDRLNREEEDLLPEEIKALPCLPSIESAIAQGYKRIIYGCFHTSGTTLLKHSDKALFISGSWGTDIEGLFLRSASGLSHSARMELDLLGNIVALMTVRRVPGKQGEYTATDLITTPNPDDYDEAYGKDLALLKNHRNLKWENDMTVLLNEKSVTVAKMKEVFARDHVAKEFLKQWSKAK